MLSMLAIHVGLPYWDIVGYIMGYMVYIISGYGGLEHFLFFHILGIIITPTDFHIFQRGRNHQPDID